MFTVQPMRHFPAPWFNFGDREEKFVGKASRKKDADACAMEKRKN